MEEIKTKKTRDMNKKAFDIITAQECFQIKKIFFAQLQRTR